MAKAARAQDGTKTGTAAEAQPPTGEHKEAPKAVIAGAGGIPRAPAGNDRAASQGGSLQQKGKKSNFLTSDEPSNGTSNVASLSHNMYDFSTGTWGDSSPV